MNETVITEDNFILFAAKCYDNPCFTQEDFFEDLDRFKYLKKLFVKYKDCKELRTRLILNHIIIIYNVFGKSATELLFFKMDGFHSQLKPFLQMLGYLPAVLKYVYPNINTDDIIMDEVVINSLRLEFK